MTLSDFEFSCSTVLQVMVNSFLYFLNIYISLFRTYTQSLMHCYEVIPEGAVCKLYFDLEFHKPSNREADGKKMVAMLIQVGLFLSI